LDDRLIIALTKIKCYYVEGYLEKQNFAIWCVDCILEQEIEVPHHPIFVDGYDDRPVCEICDKELKIKVFEYNSELNESDKDKILRIL